MDFQNRTQSPAAAAPRPAATGVKKRRKTLRLAATLAIIALAVLAIGVLFLKFVGNKTEASFLDKSKYQAVFLNGGQVYFGKVKDLNKSFLTMDNIYYLRVNEQVQPEQGEQNQAQQDISLAKLGCELHGPEDEMVINREQVTFWENLKDDGQVAKAIAEFIRQNPDGQKCNEPQAQQ